MSSLGSPSTFFLAKKKAYEIERSLRFNDDDTAYLSRTPSSAGDRKKWTFSAWIKRGNLGGSAGEQRIFGGNANASHIFFASNDEITWDLAPEQSGSNPAGLNTTQVFRDPSAWFHLVCALDTDNSTADNRMRMYVNGVEITDFGLRSNPSSGYALNAMNNNTLHTLGYRTSGQGSAGMEFDGYMAEINFIDGQQYDASYFGETDALTGQWNPKKYGGGYGTNGFYLNFSTNTLGTDRSGNGNNFTPNNFSVVAGVGNDALSDTPTNNFPTFNPVDPGQGSSVTLSNGNMDITTATASSTTYSNFVIPKTGKWFMEATMTNNGPNYAPIIQATNYIGMPTYTYTNSNLRYYINGQKRLDGTWSSYGATFTQNDVIGVAVDVDNNQVTFYKNGASQGAISFTFASGVDYFFAASDGSSFDSGAYSWNFGQRDFVYTQPTGFETICSANLPEPTIKLPNKHFDTLLYTGNGSGQTLSGLNFSPDWLWIKSRSSTEPHELNDQVRGTLKSLSSNLNAAENTASGRITAFTSDGFTLGNSGNVNSNSENFVAWNWDAGETDGKTYTVTVVDDSGNKFRFDGFAANAVTLDLAEGGTYIFNYPSGHPFRFSTTSDGTHGGGSEYTTGVTHNSSTQVTIVVAASAPTLYYYCSSHSGMGGQVNTNSTLGSSNFDGDIQTTLKVNATAGFSIVSFTDNYAAGSGTYGIGHGLGVKPALYIVKLRNDTSSWWVWHQDFSNQAQDFLHLNSTNAKTNNALAWGNTAPDSTKFYLTEGYINNVGDTAIAYCFSEVAGYSKFGSYTGNGSTDGMFVFTSFRPAWVMMKSTTLSSTGWLIYDTARSTFNEVTVVLQAHVSTAEVTAASIDILSNGFKFKTTDNAVNGSGQTYIYLAFAESPFKNARAR